MEEEGDEVMTMEGPRVLDKLFAKATISTDNVEPPSTGVTIVGDNWERLSNIVYVSRSYYDLSGYNRDYLTSFFSGTDIQEEVGPTGDMHAFIVDLITTEYVDDASIIAAHFENVQPDDLPGFPQSTYDMQQVIYGRTRSYNPSTNWVTPTVSEYSRSSWGTCSASTADKIHLTRICYLDIGLPLNTTFSPPPCNYVTAIIVAKEKELPFLMRQKRSYELATGP